MNGELVQNKAYHIAVTYGSDAETTTVNLKLMTGNRGKWVVGHEFTTPSDHLGLFIDQVWQTIGGVAGDLADGGVGVMDLADGSLLSIHRTEDGIVFSAPVKLIYGFTRVLYAPMTMADATRMADDLDAVQDAINAFLDAGVTLIESGDTPTCMAFATKVAIDAVLARASDQVLLMNERLPKTLG